MNLHSHENEHSFSSSGAMSEPQCNCRRADVDRRTHILDAAERSFVRAGFHRTTMQDVAAEAGMSPGNLYRYFPSKDALVAGLCERDRGELGERIRGGARRPARFHGRPSRSSAAGISRTPRRQGKALPGDLGRGDAQSRRSPRCRPSSTAACTSSSSLSSRRRSRPAPCIPRSTRAPSPRSSPSSATGSSCAAPSPPISMRSARSPRCSP